MREHRGDGHVAAWISHVDSTEIALLSELWWGIEPGSYVWTRGYDAEDVAAARGRLTERGLLDGDGTLTDAGGDQFRTWYTHGVCHWIGMDVHDVGDYKIGNEWRVVRAGKGVTAEAGLRQAEWKTVELH